MSLTPSVTSVGQSTPISVQVQSQNGVRKAAAFVEQNGTRYQVWQLPEASKLADNTWNFNVGTSTVPQLKDGKAKLIVEATSSDWLRKEGSWEGDVTVVTRPPTVSVDSDQHYLYLGMADLVAFDVSGNYEQAGVRVGDQTYRAWPMPAGKPGMFSLFAYSWNMPPGTAPLVYASIWRREPGNQSDDRTSSRRKSSPSTQFTICNWTTSSYRKWSENLIPWDRAIPWRVL